MKPALVGHPGPVSIPPKAFDGQEDKDEGVLLTAGVQMTAQPRLSWALLP